MIFISKNQNGFTLIEVLIALFIFSVGILGVATMQITSIKGNSTSRQVSEASIVAADHIERFMSLDYTDPALTDGTGTNDGVAGLDDLSPADGSLDSNGDGVNDTFWNIADDSPLPNTKTIRIFVDPPGSGKNVEMNYIKADII